MIAEKLLFLALVAVSIKVAPIAMIGAIVIAAYVFFKESKIQKQELEDVYKAIAHIESIIKSNKAESDDLSQKLKDSIISLKMDRGINKMTRS